MENAGALQRIAISRSQYPTLLFRAASDASASSTPSTTTSSEQRGGRTHLVSILTSASCFCCCCRAVAPSDDPLTVQCSASCKSSFHLEQNFACVSNASIGDMNTQYYCRRTPHGTTSPVLHCVLPKTSFEDLPDTVNPLPEGLSCERRGQWPVADSETARNTHSP